MLMILLFAMSFQELNTELGKSWEELARPWMTLEESALYDRLATHERKKFRGAFIARRLEQPQRWPGTGLYLPAFYCPTNHGDIRDQIRYALGEPREKEAMANRSGLPGKWAYEDAVFYFLPGNRSGTVKLARRSLSDWDRVVAGLVRNPHIRYDFRVRSFGRTRLPEDMTWLSGRVLEHWLEPTSSGARLDVMVDLPAEFRDHVRNNASDPVQHMEALLLLRRGDDESFGQLLAADRIRHGSQRLNLLEAPYMTFSAQLPPGHYQVELLMYSGFLTHGVRARRTMTIVPPDLPRVGDPIISQNWKKAGIEMIDQWGMIMNGVFYQPTHTYNPDAEARVMVHSLLEDTRLRIQSGPAQVRELKPVATEGFMHLFELPRQDAPFRLTALGIHPKNNLVAYSAKGPPLQPTGPTLDGFLQDGHRDYLALEELELENRSAELTLLSVNGHALVGSKNGRFEWPSVDWGPEARLMFESASGKQVSEHRMSRNSVYQEIRVEPKFLVAGTRKLTGEVEAVDFKVKFRGQPAEIIKRTPMADLPKLWGIVVNDALLGSPAWPTIRESLARWAVNGTEPSDLVYIVHISHRPELIQEPTAFKPLIRAGLDALIPRTRNENIFTVQYLIDALTHMEEHQTRSHQVLLLTNQLTDEVEQMQNLIPVLRQTSLQIYNLEFPFEFKPESEAKLARMKPDALTSMGERERQYQQERLGIKDVFQEERNVLTPVYGWRFGSGKAKKKEREIKIREEAFKESFNQQLAALTAGIAHTSGFGETIQSLHMFFEKLGQWQETLVHVELAEQNLTEDDLRLETPDGYVAYWTLVEWR